VRHVEDVEDQVHEGTEEVNQKKMLESINNLFSAVLKRPGKLLRIRPEVFDFEPELGRKRSQTKPEMPSTVPTDRHTTIPNDSGSISVCFDDHPKLLNCEIARPSPH
jgi:hypothetical protein